MNKKTFEREQMLYCQQILEIENKINDLHNYKRQMENVKVELENDLIQGFQKLSEIKETTVISGNSNYLCEVQSDEEQKRIFLQNLNESIDEIEIICKKEIGKFEDERESFYKRKGEFLWD